MDIKDMDLLCWWRYFVESYLAQTGDLILENGKFKIKLQISANVLLPLTQELLLMISMSECRFDFRGSKKIILKFFGLEN